MTYTQIAIAVVIATVPFAWYMVLDASAFFRDAASAIRPLTDKTTFGLLRLIHFVALAYIAFHAVGVTCVISTRGWW